MTRTTEAIMIALLTAGLAGGGSIAPRAETSAPADRADTTRLQATARLEADLRRVIADVRIEAIAAGVSWRVLDSALADLAADVSILDLLVAQPEHVMAPWEYMSRLVSEKRIAEGRARLAEHGATLDEVEARFGVDRHVVVAIWGVESSYGTLPGTRPVIRSLATLAAADPRRPAFWRKELVAALRILERGDIAAERMSGSWAGAMGHTQFMPSSFLAHAADLDGDGRRDIWQSVPDALASTANYLRNAGWRSGEAWGLEVVVPAGFDYSLAAPREARRPAAWQSLGLVPPAGADWPVGIGEASLLLPTGMHGPAFLVGANFHAVLKYNNSILYALAVGHLADRLAGRPALAALWPTHDPPLDRAGRMELQELLAAEGHAVGAIDGIIGDGTRSAVRAWQGARGMAPDGWPGTMLLERLRHTRSAAQDY